MERELVELFEAAKRAADAAVNGSSSEEDRCIDALKLLKNFPVTMQILVSTQVGKRLRQLTKHPREKIQAKASDLLKYWKKIVIDETAENNTRHGNNSVNNQSSTKVEIKSEKSVGLKVEKSQKSEAMKIENDSKAEYIKVERTSKAEPIKIHDVSKTETIKVEKHTSAGSGKPEKLSTWSTQTGNTKKSTTIPINPPKLTSMVKCNDSVRDKLREILAEAFSKVSSEAAQDIIDNVNACDPIRVAVSVESVMFEKLGRSNGPQKFKYRSIMFNLKDPNNPDLRRRVLLGEIKPDKLINMTPEEMASDQRKHENNQIKEKALFDCERAGAPKATTDQFKCGRCGQRKTTYYQLQTRSADEPMTTFVTCVNCNNHWKFC